MKHKEVKVTKIGFEQSRHIIGNFFFPFDM